MAKASTTLKLPRELKARIARAAKKAGKTPHGFMVEALERQTTREERVASFVQEALDANRKIDAGGEVFAADDVHAWLTRLASGERPARPKPWRR
jgi:predicted transcriptional regulator